MVTVYVFKAYYKGAVASAADAKAVLQAFGGLQHFEDHFGGSMGFGMPSDPNFLGVWGHRNAARFRRILREQLGDLTIIHSAPPARHTLVSVNGLRLNRLERDQNEKKFTRLSPGH
jgi:hypothetical protein